MKRGPGHIDPSARFQALCMAVVTISIAAALWAFTIHNVVTESYCR